MSGYMKFPWILFFFILAVPASPARSSTVTAPVQENTRTDTALPVVATPWEELVAEGTQLGMDAGRVKDVLGHLAMAGKSPAESREIFVPIFKMAQQNLPTEILLLKVEEGTEKNVATALIIKAVSLRAQALQAAQSLLRQEGFQLSAHQGGCLIEALTMAFETGVPSSFLVKILRKGKEQRIGKIRACVEASEMFFWLVFPSIPLKYLSMTFLKKIWAA